MWDKKSFMQVALASRRPITGAPIPITPFGDWDYYYITKEIKWHSNNAPDRIVIAPKGFVTDLASVPRLFWSIFPPAARYSYAAIIHDYLYWYQPCDRSAADRVLKDAMHDLGAPKAKIFIVYKAVRLAGGWAWVSNAAAKASGERRILKIFPPDIRTTWSFWRTQPDVFSSEDGLSVCTV